MPAAKEAGEWKTTFYKRGFGGMAGSDKPDETTLRVPIPVYFDGTKARVRYKTSLEKEVNLVKASLAKGVNWQGEITGEPYPLTFKSQPGLTLAMRGGDVTSDPAEIPVTKGLWYLQGVYSGKFAYGYDADGTYQAAGSQMAAPLMSGQKRVGIYMGNAYRVDVFTTDPRSVIACWGDSITAGAASSQMGAHSYPEILAQLIDRPTVNLGVNGDFAIHSANAPSEIGVLKGVDTVIYLMGINDVFNSAIKERKQFTSVVSPVISGLKQQGKKVFLGTILPAGGNPQFDNNPAKEELRQSINEWIRANKQVDGVIDFDEAMRDPADPKKILEAYQADRIHPNDAGYQKMAETAAAKLKTP